MAWDREERELWFRQQRIQRSYLTEVVAKIRALEVQFEVVQYGALELNLDLYPVYLLKSKNMDSHKKSILITGGVHGYETSGVHGALAFLEREASGFQDFNLICAPCISPWAYETINRWNAKAIDPNRSFHPESPAEECQLFMAAIANLKQQFFAHFDLHETTDTDNTVFRPALESRDGVHQELWAIPDGFYLVGDSEKPRKEFQKAIVDAVREVTHIAPHDGNRRIIGVPIEQEGVINYELKKLSLCAGFSGAEYTTTTEVYPDSPKVTPAICIDAQVAAIKGGLKYLRNSKSIERSSI